MEQFDPIPEIGKRYITTDGSIIIVKDYVEDASEGVYVVCVKEDETERKLCYEMQQWNEYVVKEYTEEIPQQNMPPIPSSEEKTPTDKPEDSKDKPGSFSTTAEDQYSPDSKIKELSELLETGPKQFNQKFFPTDESLPENNIIDKEAEEAFQKTLDGIEEQRGRGRSLKGTISKISEFLWICAGVDRDLLRTCATDWAKKAGVGGTILGTAVLAAFSGGYAAYTVFGNMWGALAVGLIWSLVIFNLDRYLVNSMYSDGTARITKEEWISAIPRLVIALFIGIIISAPIEMRIFDGKIQKYLQHRQTITQSEKYAQQKDNMLSLWDRQIQNLNADILRLEKQEIVDHKDYQQEIDGSGGSGKVGHGKIAETKAKRWNDTHNELTAKKHSRDSLQKVYNARLSETTRTLARNDSVTNEFSTRLEAMLIITGAHYKDVLSNESISSNELLATSDEKTLSEEDTQKEEKSLWPTNSLFWVRILIMLFFMTIEIMPVLAKMMQENGQYDKILILESNTREQLERIKEYNNINILRPSNLGYYVNAIIGHEIMEDENHNESVNAFVKKDIKRENKDETERDNQEIFRYARQRAKEHVMRQIDLIFGISATDQIAQTTSSPQSNTQQEIIKDASDEADTING